MQPPLLRYHQAVMDLLSWEPYISAEAVAALAAAEERCGFKLPAAVREWYSIGDVRRVTSDIDSLDWFLTHLQPPGSNWGAHAVGPNLCIGGDGGDGSYILLLTGEDDPPILEQNEPAYGDFDLHPIADHFSLFVMLYAHYWSTWLLHWSNVATGPMQLDYLREHFREGPSNRPDGARPLYTFYNAGMLLIVEPGGDASVREFAANWSLRAETEESFSAALQRLWLIPGIAQETPQRLRPSVQRVVDHLRAGQ